MDVAHLVPARPMSRWLRSPALHFLLIGGLLFTVGSQTSISALREDRGPASATIVIGATERAERRAAWIAQTGRPPTAEEERALVERAIDEEILYREALARRLDRGDPVIRHRLVHVMRFLSDDPPGSEEALFRDALGLDRGDLVVRRHIVQVMRLLARQPGEPKPVTDDELGEWLEREPERYRIPPRVTLTHVFLGTARRGGAAGRDARRVLAELRAGSSDPRSAPALGDPFPLSHHVAEASRLDLERIFGPRFADAIDGLEAGKWAGPIGSSHGQHLVFVHERLPARMPPLEAVRTQVRQRLREVKGEERLRARLVALRGEYRIHIEEERPADRAADELTTGWLPRPQAPLGD